MTLFTRALIALGLALSVVASPADAGMRFDPAGSGRLGIGALGSGFVARGMGVNHAWTQTYETSGGTSFGRMFRIRLKSHVAFRCFRVVFATFWQAGSTSTFLFDQEWPAPLNIQAAFEYPYTAARTGIPTGRLQTTFNGSATFAYGGTGTNPTGLAVGDRQCAPTTIPTDTYFGLWSSVEPPTSQPLTYAITALSSSGTTATATVGSTTGLYVGEFAYITGASVTGYNGIDPITAIVDATHFTYTTTASSLAAATTANAVPQFLPANVTSSGAVERYEGTTTATSSSGSFVATNAVANATSLSALNSGATGVNAGFVPAFLLIDYGPNDSMVVDFGDSTEYGVSSGGATNVLARDGDSMGQPDHPISWMDQGVYINNNKNFVNAGKGGDGAKFLFAPSHWPYRRNALALMNPTHVLNGMAFNDQGQTPYGAWTASTSYTRGNAVVRGSNAYAVVNTAAAPTCTSGTSGPAGTTAGAYETDGTCTMAYLGASTYNGAQGFSYLMAMNDQLRALLPGVPIFNTTMMPTSTSTDNYTTTVNQTCTAASAGQRNNFNTYVKTRNDLLGSAGVFNPDTYVENNPMIGDCIWIADGSTPNLATTGAHFNGYGDVLGSQAIPAGSIGR